MRQASASELQFNTTGPNGRELVARHRSGLDGIPHHTNLENRPLLLISCASARTAREHQIVSKVCRRGVRERSCRFHHDTRHSSELSTQSGKLSPPRTGSFIFRSTGYVEAPKTHRRQQWPLAILLSP